MNHPGTKKCIHIVISSGCLLFTIYQTINCVIKYQGVPKGTSMGLIDSDKVGGDFPAITFCTQLGPEGGEEYTAFNGDKLQSCKIDNG